MSPSSNLRLSSATKFAAVVVALLLTATNTRAGETFNGVSLKITNETVPAGDVLQMKLFLTEPKPIVKGSMRSQLNSSLITNLNGAYMYDPSGKTAGVAVLDSGGVRVSFTSALGQLGSNSDDPLLTLAATLRSDLRTGTTAPLSLDMGSSFFTDPQGHPYPQELKKGTLTINGTLSISDVVPGGGLVQAGQTVSIVGTGFQPNARLDINEVRLSSVRVVSPTRIDAVLAAPALLDSRRVRVRTSEGQATYYSYQRTTLLGRSSWHLLQVSEPIFANHTFKTGSLTVNQMGSTFSGLALQNSSNAATVATMKLFTKQGGLLATKTMSLPALSKSVREVRELFAGAQQDDTVRITVPAAIQMLGLLADDSAGVVAPVTIGLQ